MQVHISSKSFFQQPFLALPEDNEHNDALISLETGAGPQRSGGIRNVTPLLIAL